jgi:predicted RNase H-like HicB family nuclease
MRDYNLSLIFYPQDNGGYMVVCPELIACFTEGRTVEEAETNIMELISEDLPERVNRGGADDEEMFRKGACARGKLFREIEVSIDDAGEVVIPSAAYGVVAAV